MDNQPLDNPAIDNVPIDGQCITMRVKHTVVDSKGETIVAGSDIYRGTLNLLLLQTLTMGTLHGYAIGAMIREQSDGLLDPGEGVLYPALRRMEKKRWVSSKWGKTSTGRKARFYTITDRGRNVLKKEMGRWEGHIGAVSAVLRHAGG